MQDQLIRAVQGATRKLASSGNFNLLMKDVLAICVDAVGASGGTIYLHDAAMHRLNFQHVLPESVRSKLPVLDIPEGFGAAGQAFQSRKTVVRDFAPKAEADWNEFEKSTGEQVLSIVATPLMMEDEEPIGVVQLLNKTDGVFSETDCAVLDTVAAVATMAFLNYQLTEESSRASTLLGMGKVSHDIGNLASSLHATLSIGDFELAGLKEELRGRTDESGETYLESIEATFAQMQSSVDRIVGYARLVSDMSAGRELRPNKELAPLGPTIESASAHLIPEARKHAVALKLQLDEAAPVTLHDQLYIFRIVQNLVGNAIKAVQQTIPVDYEFDPDDDDHPPLGEVCVTYRFCDGRHQIEVRDTGPGMTTEICNRILRGTARSNWDRGGGSGWGMKIVKDLASTHDAELSIDSELGSGSTFIVTIPHAGTLTTS